MEQTEAKAAAHILVKGLVQGVGYRFFAQDTAEAAHLTGWVRNAAGGEVEIEVEGPRPQIERWVEQLKKGPWSARVDSVEVEWKPSQERFVDFRIRG